MQAKSFEPPYFHGSVMEVYICKFISNLRKPLFSLNVFYFQSYPLRDLYFAHGKFYLSMLNCFTYLLYFSSCLRENNIVLSFAHSVLYCFPSITLKTEIFFLKPAKYFFYVLNDSWNFTSCTECFYLIKEVDMDFFAAQDWQQKTNLFSWFSDTSIQWVCLALFMYQKCKKIWDEFLKSW